jgi:hypothetical protein
VTAAAPVATEIALPDAGPYWLLLTHDIDHLSLRAYPVLDRIWPWFVKRSLVDNAWRYRQRSLSGSAFLGGVRTACALPLVKLGRAPDPWEQSLHVVRDLEQAYDVRSTLFFLPVPDDPGLDERGRRAPRRRAARYDVARFAPVLRALDAAGWEIGVHGLNAHVDAAWARAELAALRAVVPARTRWGLRMHWLYQSATLRDNLRAAGFSYDATFGSNDLVGFPDGRRRPFLAPEGLWVVPLVIQDGTLLARSHLGLSETAAWDVMQKVVDEAAHTRGVVTVLWHNTSLVAPAFQQALYCRLLDRARGDGAWVGSIEQFLSTFAPR